MARASRAVGGLLASAAQHQVEEKLGQGAFPSMPHIEQTTINNGLYTIVTDVRDQSVDPNIPSNLYEINVTVTWRDDADVARSLTFSTYSNKP